MNEIILKFDKMMHNSGRPKTEKRECQFKSNQAARGERGGRQFKWNQARGGAWRAGWEAWGEAGDG